MQHDFILLDRSGSMISLWGEAISSINAYVHKLAADNIDTGVTLAAFDTEGGGLSFTVLRDRIIPKTWMDVTPREVTPRGLTPLNDATGKIVNLARAGNYDKVAIIIMTDGHENASKELRVDQVKALLDDCRAKNWQVIFLGANFDNVKQAADYGASAHQTVQSSVRNLGATMDSLSSSRAAYAVGDTAMGFSEEEKRTLKQD